MKTTMYLMKAHKFKYSQRIRVNKPGDKWHGYYGIVAGYLTDGFCYIELGDRGPKKRNGKPLTLTYQEAHLETQ